MENYRSKSERTSSIMSESPPSYDECERETMCAEYEKSCEKRDNAQKVWYALRDLHLSTLELGNTFARLDFRIMTAEQLAHVPAQFIEINTACNIYWRLKEDAWTLRSEIKHRWLKRDDYWWLAENDDDFVGW